MPSQSCSDSGSIGDVQWKHVPIRCDLHPGKPFLVQLLSCFTKRLVNSDAKQANLRIAHPLGTPQVLKAFNNAYCTDLGIFLIPRDPLSDRSVCCYIALRVARKQQTSTVLLAWTRSRSQFPKTLSKLTILIVIFSRGLRHHF